MILDKRRKEPTPMYYRLQLEIRDKIERGKWKPGNMIPPERVFVEENGISIGTVKKAITNLVNEGFLYRVQGRGTFVTDTQLRRNRLRYYRLFKDFNDTESKLKFQLLNLEIIPAVKPINQYLKLRMPQNLFLMKRLLFSDRFPAIYSISYLPEKQFKNLDSSPRTNLENRPLYKYLEEQYDIPTLYNQELIGAVAADKETAELLGVKPGSPLLYIEMLSFTYKDKPYEYRISYCRTDIKKVFRAY